MPPNPPLLTPSTDAELVDAVLAIGDGALEVRGQGSKRGLGRAVEADAVLQTTGLAGIVAYEADELVLTAKAGTPLAEIRAVLGERGQHLAFEPPDLGPLYGLAAGAGTLGGMVAAGLAGPRRLTAGGARDHVLGFSGVSGHGEAFKAGGRVVKNVTGFDLPKLIAGSMGTLAVLSEVSVKVMPAPPETRTVVVVGRSDGDALALLARALAGPRNVDAAAHLPEAVAGRSAVQAIHGARGPVTLSRVEGFARSVAARTQALVAQLGADFVLGAAESAMVWREIADAAPFAGDGDERTVWRLSVPPALGARVAEEILRAEGEGEFYFDWGGGLIWLALPEGASVGAVRAAMAFSGGHATLIRAPAATRAGVDVFQPPPPELAPLIARVKDAFDPGCRLNRGRLYAGP